MCTMSEDLEKCSVSAAGLDRKAAGGVSAARLEYIAAVCIYGTISILIRWTGLSGEVLACYRAILGTFFIFLYQRLRGQKPDMDAIKANLPWLFLSGASLGLNWVFLFEAYIKTSVSVASLINYTAPVIVVVIAPLVLHEHLDIRKMPCLAASFLGVVLISGVLEGGGAAGGTGAASGAASGAATGAAASGPENFTGIICAMLASLTFVGILIFTKKLTYVPHLDKILVQLVSAAIVITIYTLIKDGCIPLPQDMKTVAAAIILGAVYTAFANILYFAGISGLPVQAIAVLGYLESVTAIIVSLVVFKEPMSILSWIGAVLIIASSIICELMPPQKE